MIINIDKNYYTSKEEAKKHMGMMSNVVSNCKLRSNGMPVPLLRNGYSIFNGTKYR